MPQIKTPGTEGMLKAKGIKQNTSPTNWKVRFDYKGTGKGQATFTFGIAGDVNGGVRALMNGHQIVKMDSFEGPKGDNTYYRQAAHGIFRQYTVPFNATLLKQGANIMELTPPGSVSANSQGKIIMFDFLRLEVQE